MGVVEGIFAQYEVTPEWAISIYYCLMMFACAVVMKVSNALIAKGPPKERLMFLFFAPVISLKTWQARTKFSVKGAMSALFRVGICTGLLLAYYLVGRAGLEKSQLGFFWQAYVCIVPFWLLVEAAGAYTELSFTPFGILLPPINRSPWRSTSLSEFWGQRWNRVFGDWFYQTCFRPLRRTPRLGQLSTFFVSALIHELIVSVPFWLVYQRSVFGFMMAYFGIQALGMLIDRKFLRRSPFRRTFMWVTLLAPAPFIFNEATLRIFHLGAFAGPWESAMIIACP